MKVYFVGAGPGNPELLTRKAEKLLRTCRFCIHAGSLVNPQVLDLLPSDAARHDSSRLDLEQIISLCVEAQEQNLDVVRLHTGDPSIYGSIAEQMAALDQHGIEYEVVPGVSSFQAAAAALSAELTIPEISQTVILTRIGDRTPVPEEQSLRNLAQTRATLCLFLSVHKLAEIAPVLADCYGPQCPAAVVFRASWPDQKIIRGTVTDIASRVDKAGITKTAMILVGHALGEKRNQPNSRLYDSRFTHGYRTGIA